MDHDTRLRRFVLSQFDEIAGPAIPVGSGSFVQAQFAPDWKVRYPVNALSPATPQRPRPQTVLIVEDNPDLRRIFADALFWAGFRVEQADDGVTALHMIENDRPDVLVLDIGLPTLDGLSVRDELAANAETGDIPVIIVTGAEFTWKLRSDDRVLQKPVSPDRLVATIRACLSAV